MLIIRTISSIVGIFLLAVLIICGGYLYSLAIVFLALISWLELSSLFRKVGVNIEMTVGFLLIVLNMTFVRYANSTECDFFIFIGFVWLLTKVIITKGKFNIGDCLGNIFCFFYISFLFSHFIELRFIDEDTIYKYKYFSLSFGSLYLSLALIGTWINDSFAYLVGSSIGKYKINSKISPKKTWEGFICGTIGTILFLIISVYLLGFPIWQGISIGLIVTIFAFLGDMAESALKRFCGVKDSGKFVPGHGGILDRFDSMLFVVPAIYYFVVIVILNC